MTANDTQIGGTHYKGAKCPHCGESLEHWDLAWLFKWDNFQYSITKYVMRWRTKHGIEDLEKAGRQVLRAGAIVTWLRGAVRKEEGKRKEDLLEKLF